MTEFEIPVPRGFIEVHDGDVSARKYPEGKRVLVRASSIDSIRPYAGGRVRAVLGIHGSFLHVVESEETLVGMLKWAEAGMRIPKITSLPDLLRRKPRLASDYRTYDMRSMRSWGHNAFWWPSEAAGRKACIFGPTPRVGDALISDSESGLGLVFVIVSVNTPRDPGDQHFVEVVRWGRPSDLPEPAPREGEDWIS